MTALASSRERIASASGRIVSRDEWLAARKALLADEKALTRARDEVARKRRALPWVKVDKAYVFDSPAGKKTLADLFGPRSQLAVYHFMLTPDSDHICPGCSLLSDHVDAARQHFEQADLSFCAISRVPLERIEAVKRRMGWTFNWVSSAGTTFNYDFGVSFPKEDIAAGGAVYNYGTPIEESEDMHGTSVFAMDESGAVYHTYSTYARGDEPFLGAFHWLDITPKGRNEIGGIMSWVRLHDEYERAASDGCCTSARSEGDRGGNPAEETDMIEPPHIVETKPVTAAMIRLKVPRAELPKVVPTAIDELLKAIAAQGLSPQGPLFMHHLTMSTEEFDVEVGFPVARVIGPAGRVQPGKLPAAKVARTIYQGPYEGLYGAWDAFGKRLESDGLADQSCVERAGTLWESYLVGPETTTDPTKWRTELNLPLRSIQQR